GSVVGDTTTTMMWIDGVDPLDVLEAFVAAGAALFVFGIPASLQQHKHSPIIRDAIPHVTIDWPSFVVVGFILSTAIGVNVTVNVKFGHLSDQFPFIGAAVWIAILLATAWRKPDWFVLPEAFKGSIFLLSLIL